jgi:transcriptional regulator with XRE-family HTH domain
MANHPPVQRFGEKVRQLRLRHGMTMQMLAERLGSSSAYISRVENGQLETRIGFAVQVARFFGVSTDVLLDDALEVPE